jgi:phenylalanyl-tRNA synthetase beta subunit
VPFQVEPVEIINGEERFLTPNVSPREFTVSHKNAENLIGGKLLPEQVIGYLKRTGLTATVAS